MLSRSHRLASCHSFVVVCVVLATACSYTQAAGVNHQRHIVLDGQSNFRDIGGYRTTDGQTVRWGQVFRSGDLNQLTASDIVKLKKLGITTDVNLMTPSEISTKGEDRLPTGVSEINLPINSGDDYTPAIIHAKETGDYSAIGADRNTRLQHELVAEGRDQYAQLFRCLLEDNDRPLVFHCSQGIHRTGTATALVLWSLGVPWETIREDYLLSNTCRQKDIDARMAHARKLSARNQDIPESQINMEPIQDYYILTGEEIDATRAAVLSEYGTIDGYLTKGLGLSEAELDQLRTKMLK